MKIQEVIHRLVGPIYPTGSHGTDTDRLKNIEAHIDAAEYLVRELHHTARYAHHGENSIVALAEKARKALDSLNDYTQPPESD